MMSERRRARQMSSGRASRASSRHGKHLHTVPSTSADCDSERIDDLVHEDVSALDDLTG